MTGFTLAVSGQTVVADSVPDLSIPGALLVELSPNISHGVISPCTGAFAGFLIPVREANLDLCEFRSHADFPQCITVSAPVHELQVRLRASDHTPVVMQAGAEIWFLIRKR